MNKYPSYIPQGSGYLDYPFAANTHHLGVYNNMDWDKSKTLRPISEYHPYYLHHIHDSLLTLKDPANAATIELGVGKHIVEIARYANSNNLGYPNQRIGVAYFKEIGVSGGVTWWNDNTTLKNTTVNFGLSALNLDTDNLSVYSGYFNNVGKFSIYTLSNTLDVVLSGNCYIDQINDHNRRWIFTGSDIKTLDGFKLFGGFAMVNGSGVINTSGTITFNESVSIRDITLSSNKIVSGVIDTYQKNGVSDYNLITYSNAGHTHDASGWFLPTTDSIVVGNTIFDGRYYYMVSQQMVCRLDGSDLIENWSPFQYTTSNYDSNTRVFKDNKDVGVVNLYGKPGDKVATINGLSVYGKCGSDTLTISDGRSFQLSSAITTQDEFYYIDGNVYFVHINLKQIIVYKFNGKVWKQWNSIINGTFINSCVSNNEIFLSYSINSNLFGLVRFNTIGIFKNVNSYSLFGDPKNIVVLDHDIVCLCKDFINDDKYSVYLYNLNKPTINQLLFNDMNNEMISIYSNLNYIFVQIGSVKRKIRKNKSTALSLDAIGGIYNLKDNIKVNGSIKNKSLITALCANSLFKDNATIYKHLFLLEPGRNNDDSVFEYTGDFKDTYINRYVFNSIFSDVHIYSDQTCSVFFNNTYYFGHRGDITSFIKSNDIFQLVNPTTLKNKIIVKFLPLDKTLFALVQDFDDATVDYVYPLPESPYARENGKTNFIPYHPGPWSIPMTKLFRKVQNSWVEETKYTEKHGRNIIDAISHDNNIYVLAHTSVSSGIASYKYSYDNINDPSGISMCFSGNLILNESFFGLTEDGPPLAYEFTSTSDGKYIMKDVVSYYTNPLRDCNGHHVFYLYNHPIGPYVVHDQVEVLHNTIGPSSLYAYWNGSSTQKMCKGYVMENKGSRYNYRTLSISFLREELPRPSRSEDVYDFPIQISNNNVNNPNIKIPIIKDHPHALSSQQERNKTTMKSLADDRDCNRSDIHFITSITHNKIIYLLVQIDQVIRIYQVRDFGDYTYVVPNLMSPLPAGISFPNVVNSVSGVSSVVGEGLSYAGLKTNIGYLPGGTNYGGTNTFLDFIPCELSNTLVTEFNISDVVGNNPGTVYVLGDNDDLFIQKPTSKNYRHNKRFATHSTINIGSNLYVPITARVNHPTGRLYTFVLGFFNDGSVGLVDNENIPLQILHKPTGRTQCLFHGGKYVISSLKLTDDAQEYVDYRQVVNDRVYGKVLATDIPTFTTLYNPFAKKKWIIGEYDVRVEDNLNTRENY